MLCVEGIAEAPRQTLQWATLQNILGSALARRGEFEKDASLIGQSIAAFDHSLEVLTESANPDLWAMAQNNLGNSLQKTGQVSEDVALVRRAVVAFRRSAKARLEGSYDWAVTQNNLANALSTLGKLEQSADGIRAGIAAYAEALKVRTRDQFPVDWAMSTGNRGLAHFYLAALTGDVATAKRGLEGLVAAEAALRAGGHDAYASNFAVFVPSAKALVAQLEAGIRGVNENY
jgi:tetratricopeptide (TPR) repeat protein